jgi:hypothetical protein
MCKNYCAHRILSKIDKIIDDMISGLQLITNETTLNATQTFTSNFDSVITELCEAPNHGRKLLLPLVITCIATQMDNKIMIAMARKSLLQLSIKTKPSEFLLFAEQLGIQINIRQEGVIKYLNFSP